MELFIISLIKNYVILFLEVNLNFICNILRIFKSE